MLLSLLVQFAFALEPMNPKAICEQRMIVTEEKNQCATKAKSLKLDWYAATACNALNDDKKFLSCWQSVSGGQFNPDALGRCVESPDDTDEVILKCIVSLKDKRMPASVRKPYQTMEVKKKTKKSAENKK